MEFFIAKNEFVKALFRVQNIIETKQTAKPILADVLIEASPNHEVTLTATDLTVAMKAGYEANVIVPGSISVPYKKLFEIIKELPGETVSLRKLDNSYLEIQCEKVDYRIAAHDSVEYPRFREIEGLRFIEFSDKTLVSMIEKVLFCTSTDENRPNLTGIFFQNSHHLPADFQAAEFQALLLAETLSDEERTFLTASLEFDAEGKWSWTADYAKGENQVRAHKLLRQAGLSRGLNMLRMVTSDTHRMAIAESAFNGEIIEDLIRGVIVPKKAFSEIRKLIDMSEEPIFLGFNQNEGIIRKGKASISLRLIEGGFPDYRQIIPQQFSHQIDMPLREFQNALKRIMIMTTEQYKTIRFDFKGPALSINMNNPLIGYAEEIVDLPKNSQEFSVAFNGRYVMDGLQIIKDEGLVLDFENSMRPQVIRARESSDFRYVVMPIMLDAY